MDHAIDYYAHPEAGRNDDFHGDEGIKPALTFSELTPEEQVRFHELLDIIIADRVQDGGLEVVTKIISSYMPDETQELLTIEPVPDVDAADMRTLRHMAGTLNKFLDTFGKWMQNEYEDEILDQIADERL